MLCLLMVFTFKAFGDYEKQLDRIVSALDPLLDNPPVPLSNKGLSLKDKWTGFKSALALGSSRKLFINSCLVLFSVVFFSYMPIFFVF